MVADVLNICAVSIAYCSSCFERLLSVTGMTAHYLVMIFLMLTTRFIISPIFGSYSKYRFYSGRKVGDD